MKFQGVAESVRQVDSPCSALALTLCPRSSLRVHGGPRRNGPKSSRCLAAVRGSTWSQLRLVARGVRREGCRDVLFGAIAARRRDHGDHHPEVIAARIDLILFAGSGTAPSHLIMPHDSAPNLPILPRNACVTWIPTIRSPGAVNRTSASPVKGCDVSKLQCGRASSKA